KILAGAKDVRRALKQRHRLELVPIDRASERDAGVPADKLCAEIFDRVGVGRLDLRRVERLEIPPAEVEREQQAAFDALGVKINEPFVAALRIIPGLPARAVLPEVMPHRA